MRKSGSLILSTLMFSTFSYAQTNEVVVENLFSMKIPEHMSQDMTLNDQASLQFSNPDSEKYIIVIHESKSWYIEIFRDQDDYDESESVIDNFADHQVYFLSEDQDVLDQTEMAERKSHGMDARRVNVDANLAGINISITYFYYFVEGKDNLYTIMAWTARHQKDDFKREVRKMFNSFKEL